MAKRRYDLEALQRYVDVLDKQIDAITNLGGEVQRTVDTVLTGYTGKTADAFRNTSSEWQQTTVTLVESLRSHREQVATAHRNYSAAEAANRATRS